MPITVFRNFYFTTLLIVLAGFGSPASCAVDQPRVAVTVRWTPNEGGTATGGAVFAGGGSTIIGALAAEGWYVHGATATTAFFEQAFQNVMRANRSIDIMNGGDGVLEDVRVSDFFETSIDILVEFRPKTAALPILGPFSGQIGTSFFEGATSYTVMEGDTLILLGYDIGGARPIQSQWLKDGKPLREEWTEGIGITLWNLKFSDAGQYSYRVRNVYGTNEGFGFEIVFPASFKAFAIVGAQWTEAQSAVAFVGETTIRFETSISPALIFYTLDGSEPSITSQLYSEPFPITNSCTLRAIAYKPDLSTSLVLPEITITKGGEGVLEIPASLGGWAAVDSVPPYVVGQTVKISHGVHNNFPGAKFMGWMGSRLSTESILTLAVEPYTIVQPIFGVPATVAILGSGDVIGLKSGDVVPLGSPVPLQALPKSGFRFTQWGGMVAGTNPRVTITNGGPNLVVTALFSPLPENEVTLSVRTEGVGTVLVEPLQSSYPKGTTVSVTAMPGHQQSLLRWEGAATASDVSATLTLNESVSFSAIFSSNLVLETSLQAVPFAELSVRLPVSGGINRSYRLEQSRDLASWDLPFLVPALPFPVEPSRWVRSDDVFFRAVGN